MANTYQLITKDTGIATANNFVDSVQHESAYYVFAARSIEFDNGDATIPTPTESTKAIVSDLYDDLIFGKRVTAGDICQAIPRYTWSSGTVYDMYDDTDADLFTKPFYASTTAGTLTHVYKCLYNNNGSTSTSVPSGTDPEPFETPEDGYLWKYMYTANVYTMNKFATNEYMPVVANNTVIAEAASGAIDAIVIEDSGLGYDNYIVGAFTSTSDLNIDGTGYLYAISSSAVAVDNFYNGCIIKMTSGAAKDEYKYITGYYVSGTQKIIVLDSTFTGAIAVNDTYEIYPYVYVFDTGGTKQTNCIARAIIDGTNSNSISKIEVLEAGSGYRSATAVVGFMYDSYVKSSTTITASLVPNIASRSPIYSNAQLRAIISPPAGHGADPFEELGAKYICISTKFVGDEEPLTVSNDYRTVGVIKDPRYANVQISVDVANSVGTFATGESVYRYTASKLVGNVSVTSASFTVSGTSTLFNTSLSANDKVIISDGSSNYYGNVASIASNTSLTLSTSVPFTNTAASIYVIKDEEYFGQVISQSVGLVNISNVSPTYSLSSTRFIGHSSFATTEYSSATATPVNIQPTNRNANNFTTFTQLTKFTGTLTTAAQFTSDEFISQNWFNTYEVPQARFHSGNNTTMFITNSKGFFLTSSSAVSDGVVTGNSSGAQFTITAKYTGELVKDSGNVLYIENLNPVTRSTDQSETVKLILEF